MDAAHTQTLLRKTVLFFAPALFILAPGLKAQTPAFNNPGTVTLIGTGGGQVQVTGSGDPTAPITFTASINPATNTVPSGDPQDWVSVSQNNPTTPATLTFQLKNVGATQGTYNATVTLHATSPAGVADTTFTVTYASGSSGGGGSGTVAATPTSVTLSSSAGSTSTVQTSITLSTNSASAIGYTVSFSPINSWLQVSGTTSGSVSSGANAVIAVGANASNLTNNTYTGSVTITPSSGSATTIPVTFNVGTGAGGSITANVNPVNLSYTSGGSFQSQFVNLSTTTGSSNYVATATSSNGWLLVNSQTATSGTFASGLTVSLGANVASLPSGNYTGTIALTDLSNGSGSITVNLTVNGGTTNGLTFNPTPSTGLTFTGAPGSGSTAGQSVGVTSTTAGTLTVNCTPISWLTCFNIPANIGANTQTNITVVANATGLSAGTYNGSVSVQVVNGSTTLSGSVPVSFVVGSGSTGGGATGFAVAPTSLNFTYQTGTNRNFVARQTLGITGLGSWNSVVTTTSGGNWLNLSTILANFQSDGTSSTTVTIDPTNLTIGTYTGSISIISNGVTQNVGVTLSVVPAPILLPTPGSALFNFHSGDPALQPVSIFLSASDGSPVTATAATTTTWLTVTQTAGSTSFSISANPAGLSSGIYTGNVAVTQSNLGNSPMTIPVVLIVNGGTSIGGGGALTLSPTSLTFNAVVNGSSPQGQSISVTAATPTNFTVTTSTTGGTNWLSTSQSSGITPVSNFTVFANSSGLPIGTYNGTVTFTANGSTQTLSVVLNVTAIGTGSGNVIVDKSSLSFTGQTGAGALTAQALTITSAQGSSPVSFSVSTNTTNAFNWLSTNATGITLNTPFALSVSANIGSLQPGTYNGTLLITPTGGTTLTVPVSLTVTSAAMISATPLSLSFNYRAGDQNPAAQSVSVSAGGATSLPFTATATSNGNWLSVTPTTGTAPATLSVSINPAGLNASPTPYTGTITVAGSGGATGSSTITVSVTVTAPLPTVSKVTNAGSFITATSVSPGEIITLFASDAQHPIGPTTPAGLTLDSSGKVSTSIGGVQVFAAGFACPMIYASATQVSAVVPYELAGLVRADILVRFLGQSSNAVSVGVTTTAPGLFTLNSSGTGPAAALNSNNSVNSPGNPAAKGDTVVLYLTGEGQTSPAGVTGKVTTVSATGPLTPAPLLPISILIGPQGNQQAANYSFAGEAPGFISGAMQLNVQIPTTVNSGEQQIVVSIGSNSSQSGATISVK